MFNLLSWHLIMVPMKGTRVILVRIITTESDYIGYVKINNYLVGYDIEYGKGLIWRYQIIHNYDRLIRHS